ncbi:MAG TPA: hypothetical protein VIV60_19605 [Polyangiaceae bacterium]
MDGQRQSSSRRRRSRRTQSEDQSPAQNHSQNPNNGQNRGQGQGQGPPSGHHQGRSKGAQRGQPKASIREVPVLIAARRPNAPDARPKRRFIAASAAPSMQRAASDLDLPTLEGEARLEQTSNARPGEESGDDVVRRRAAARIVQLPTAGPDDREKLRLKLIDRLLHSEGRVAITQAARELESAGFEFPVAQDVQLQLLEHFDESRAHQAICQLTELLNDEAPIKRPLFEQRLRRLEEFADDAETRQAAADLRRTVRA